MGETIESVPYFFIFDKKYTIWEICAILKK